MKKFKHAHIIIADENTHSRRLLWDVLRSESFVNAVMIPNGHDLLTRVEEFHPKVVIISVDLTGLSALDFTLKVRAGHGSINRALSIIATTAKMTPQTLHDLRKAGVDEVLAQPFSAATVLARVESVLLRPRRFIESANYCGPCRRRKMLEDYGGPLRRLADPDQAHEEMWEAESNRALVRVCVSKINDLVGALTEIDRRKLRELYSAAQDTEQLADDIKDACLAAASRSLNRYIVGIGAANTPDPEVITTHIDAMQTLSILGAKYEKEREELVEGLVKVVDKRLGVRTAQTSDAG